MVYSNVFDSNNVLQNVAFEIKRDRQPDAELIRKQRLLGIQMNHDPAKSDRMNNGRTTIGKRRQGFVQTRKFYRSRRK